MFPITLFPHFHRNIPIESIGPNVPFVAAGEVVAKSWLMRGLDWFTAFIKRNSDGLITGTGLAGLGGLVAYYSTKAANSENEHRLNTVLRLTEEANRNNTRSMRDATNHFNQNMQILETQMQLQSSLQKLGFDIPSMRLRAGEMETQVKELLSLRAKAIKDGFLAASDADLDFWATVREHLGADPLFRPEEDGATVSYDHRRGAVLVHNVRICLDDSTSRGYHVASPAEQKSIKRPFAKAEEGTVFNETVFPRTKPFDSEVFTNNIRDFSDRVNDPNVFRKEKPSSEEDSLLKTIVVAASSLGGVAVLVWVANKCGLITTVSAAIGQSLCSSTSTASASHSTQGERVRIDINNAPPAPPCTATVRPRAFPRPSQDPSLAEAFGADAPNVWQKS